MKITIDLDDDAATALATIIRSVSPNFHAVDVKAWYRALDALSPQLPATREPAKDYTPLFDPPAIETRPAPPPPAAYPGEPGSLAAIGRRRFLIDEIERRAQTHPNPNAAELAYRAQLAAELDRA